MRSAQRMLMWRRSLPPFTWLVKPSVGSRQSYNFPRYNCLWESAALGLVDLRIRRATENKPTNESHERKHWPGEPHMDTQRRRAGRTLAGKRPGKPAIFFRAEHGARWKHKTFILRTLRRWWEASWVKVLRKKEKKSRVQRVTFIHRILAVFPYRPWDKHHQLPTVPIWVFFFPSPFCFSENRFPSRCRKR